MDSEVEKPTVVALESETSDSGFTHANLIGLFLTLSLCLLTQPWGSLLYRPLNRGWPWISRAIFFFWRLQPLACISEVIIILSCIMDSVLGAWRRCRDEGRKLGQSEILHALHINAAALLLLRGHDDGHGPVEMHLEERLIASAATGSGSEIDTTTNLQNSSTDGADMHGLRRRTTHSDTDIESNLEPAAPLLHSASNHPDLGTLIPVHKEKWVDSIATFSVLTTFLKLLTTSLPWPFRTAAFFMLSGWFAIQSLLFFHHLTPTTLPPPSLDSTTNPSTHSATRTLKLIIARTRRNRTVIRHPLTLLTIHLFALPLIIYTSYAAGILLGHPAPESDAWADLPGPLPLPSIPGLALPPTGIYDDMSELRFVLFMPLTLPIGCVAVMVCILPLAGATLPVAWFFAEYLGLYWGALGSIFVIIIGLFVAVAVFFSAAQIATGFVYGVYGAIGLATGLLLYAGIAVPFRFIRGGGGDDDGGKGRRAGVDDEGDNILHANLLCLSTIIWAYLFVFSVGYYDATGTFKPEWLEYLG